jgi:4-diphosphocytidyl-2-C-methyl-D-erythritol kinase
MTITLISPAKVNLFFRVLHRRVDGYHEIASLYQTVSLHDRLTMTLGDEDLLTCDDPMIPCDERNLVMKAIMLFRKKTGLSLRVRVHLEKKIPIQAGLGGGSSNAATALFALCALTGVNVTDETLAEWGAELGSDISFFFSTGTAFCHSRGERFVKLSPLKSLACSLVKPRIGLSTPQVFSNCFPEKHEPRAPDLYLKRALVGDLELFNDLEEAAFSLQPSLKNLKEQLLSQGCAQVSMTGSGSAFICLGAPQTLSIPDIEIFPVDFLQRNLKQWY